MAITTPKPEHTSMSLSLLPSHCSSAYYHLRETSPILLQFILSPIDGVVLERTLPVSVNYKAATNCRVQIYVKMGFLVCFRPTLRRKSGSC